MSSQIPPLVCHTPPPMDFDDEEEDDVDLPDQEDDFDDFGSAPTAVENEDLPTPVPPPFPDFDSPVRRVRKSPSVEGSPRKGKDVSPPIPPQAVIENVPDHTELEQSRNESPPSLILSQNNFSENDVPSDDEFQDFAFHPPQEESGILPGAEDNISLPSLHLDTEVSKSTTPVQLSENDASERDSSPQEPELEDPEPEPVPEAAITPVVAEDSCCRFDDNTENDFTDFTTASNERSAVLEVPTANDVSFDDDFAHLESTPSADSNFVSQSKTDFATFDADFSKFDSFQASFPATFDDPGSTHKEISAKQVTNTEEKSTPEAPKEDDFGNDDFDDFQEFAKFPSEPENISKPEEDVAAKHTSEPSFDDDDGDDDFGEFSDFKQSEAAPATDADIVPTTRSTLFKAENILAILSEMFPSCTEDNKDDTGQMPWVDLLQRNKVYNELNDMDSTHALRYQYNNSESNKSLIRALGIDSRNILFGPKWNSSMPRFAANLSFSPLEPMKPVAASSGSNNISSSGSSATIANTSSSSRSSSSSAAKQEPPGKHHTAHSHVPFGLDPLHPSGGGASLAPGVVLGSVPAVQFDWTSSGLVNPLEASHAHTLLLDLEQLEVMANLKDKINIDSSSSSCDANVAPSSTTPLTSTITTTSMTPTMAYNNNNNHSYKNKPCNATNPTAGGGGGSLLDDLNLFCSADPPMPLKPISFADCPSHCFATKSTPTTTTGCPVSPSRPHSPSSPSPQSPPPPTPLLTTITTTTIITTTCATNGTPMNGDGHAAAAVGTSSVTTLQSFDDYLDLSVQEILQEGGALQQSNKNGSKGEVLDTKIAENSGTAAADEVVASTTHSNLEPGTFSSEQTIATSTTTTTKTTKLKAHHSSFDNAPSGNEDDDEFVFVGSSNSSNSNLHQQPTSIPTTTCPPISSHAVVPPSAAVSLALGLSSSSSSPSAGSSPLATTSTVVSSGSVVRTIKLPETHIYTPSKGVNPVSRDSTDRTEIYAEVGGDLRPSGGFDKSIAVREYRDVEYSLEKSLSKSQALAGSDEEFDDYREFQAVESSGKTEDKEWSGSKRTHLDVGGDFNFGSKKDKIGSYSKPVFGTSPTEELEQMEDDFSEFQAADPTPGPAKPIVNKPLATVSNEQNRSNTSSPILLSPSILLPQQAHPQQANETGRTAQINWPEPGIDPEELARFEAAFPKPKVAPQSSSSNNTTPKHVPSFVPSASADDEEWTDFVYSKPATEKPSPTNSRSSNPPHTNNQQEEWTDFIYSTPASQNLSSSQNNFNYQNNSYGASRLNGPKFNSWNQPQLPPPQFSSWNSNNYYHTPPTNTNSSLSTPSAAQNQKVPTFSSAHAPAHHNPNLNNYYQPPTVPSSQPRNVGQPSYIPGISQLPELSFITPNSNAGSSAPGAGVKPFAHSFLNNVISSNNFTKK